MDNFYVELWQAWPNEYLVCSYGPYSEKDAEDKEWELDSSIDDEFYFTKVIKK